MSEPLTMTNDEAQDWLMAQHNAAPGPPDPARFGAAIRAIRAKAIADAKDWFAHDEAAVAEALSQALDVLALRITTSRGGYRGGGLPHATIESDPGVVEELAKSIAVRLPVSGRHRD